MAKTATKRKPASKTPKKAVAKKAPKAKKPALKAVEPQVDETLAGETKAFLREVDEKLHYDRMMALWTTWKTPILVSLAVIILFVMAQSFYSQWHEEKLQNQAENFWLAASEDDADQVIAALEKLGEEGDAGFAVMAKMSAASLQAEQGNKEAAQNLYAQARSMSGVPETYRQLAQIYEAQMLTAQQKYNEAKALLEPLAKEGEPYRISALEGLGLIAEFLGNKAEALEKYEAIRDIGTIPPALSRRVNVRLNILEKKLGTVEQIPSTQ